MTLAGLRAALPPGWRGRRDSASRGYAATWRDRAGFGLTVTAPEPEPLLAAVQRLEARALVLDPPPPPEEP